MATTIQLAKAGGTPTPAPVGATLMKTGQTTSYRTGDDGDLEAGRETSFTVLASNNPFGNTNRFTDVLGGQTYTNNIVIDWSTYNGSNVLGWYRVPILANTSGWNEAIDNPLTASYGGFNVWRCPNIMEAISLIRWSTDTTTATSYGYNYSPFNLAADYTYWSSTTYAIQTSQAYILRPLTKQPAFANKTVLTYYYLPVRTFTVTGTTLT